MADLKGKTHLFFDLDDTLWDFEKNSSQVLEALFFEFELNERLNTDFQTFYTIYKGVNQGLWTQYYKKEIDKTFLRNHRFNETFKKFNYDDYARNLLVTEQYLERSPQGRHVKEGCHEVLDYLSRRYTLHIITNGFKEVQYIKLDGCRLRDYFSQIVISEEHALTKPDVKIFRLAEKFAGAATGDCVMIGDNYDTDITGAVNAGWQAVYFTADNPQNYTGPVIRHLTGLKQLF